jgi:CheY-like chemotaxis protein
MSTAPGTLQTEPRSHRARGSNVILVVEDNPDDVLLLQRAFRKAPLANPTRVVTDGEQAIAYLEGQGEFADREAYPLPVLALLDFKLPRRSGLEVLAWIRLERKLHGLPVVILSSSQEQEHIAAAYRAGANSYLLKPVDFDQLIALVKALDQYWMGFNVCPDQPATEPA